MNKTIDTKKNVIIFGLPLLIVLTMVFLAKSALFTNHPNKLALGITIDLLLTTPLAYLFLIRKTSIPKTTVVPFIILGVVVSSFIIPVENQLYLSLFKTWVLPIIELSVLSYIIYNVIKAVRFYKSSNSQGHLDFFTTLKSTCYKILPKGVVIPFVTEIAVFYYGFLNWKKTTLEPNEFSYHKESGTVGLLMALLFLIAIETFAFHLLLSKWSTIAAWILTGISVYSGIQILGFLKSMLKRPIVIEDDVLYLRYGIMNETTINIQDIESIEAYTKDIERNKDTRKLSFLGDLEGHNLMIKLRKEHTLIGLYGIKRKYKNLALHVDKKLEFKNFIESTLHTDITPQN